MIPQLCPDNQVPFPELESDLFLLREHNDLDKDSYYRMMSNPDVVRYYGREPMIHREDIDRDYTKMRTLHIIGDTTRFAVILKKSGDYVGTVGVHHCHSANRGTLSCIFDCRYWRKGFATEALRTLMQHLIRQEGYHRLQVFVDPRNHPAICLFEKLGFKTEATLHQYEIEYHEFIDLQIMSYLVKR